MSEFLTQSVLAEHLSQKTGISLETAKNFSKAFFSVVRKGLKDSESFSVYNFGTFKKTWIESTVGFNPQNGVKIEIPAHWKIRFVPCSALSKRVNKKYSHLKPKVIKVSENGKVSPNGLYAKASKLEEESKAVTVLADAPDFLAVSPVQAAENSFGSDSKKRTEKPSVLILLGVAVILIVILIAVLVKSCFPKESGISQDEKRRSENEDVKPDVSVQKDSEKNEADTEIKTGRNENPYDEISAEALFESYLVSSGGCYNKIAEEKYKNRHLWPVIYSANKGANPDPDYIGVSSKIKIPELPENTNELNRKIVDSALDAYNGYLLMCEKQPESAKNEIRRNRAVRVLVSGELVLPGFIDTNSSRILPEYAEKAKSIVKNQYKM